MRPRRQFSGEIQQYSGGLYFMAFTGQWSLVLVLGASLGLSACGGGGGGGTDTTPPPSGGTGTNPPPNPGGGNGGDPTTPPPATGFSLSPTTITFTAATPNSSVPASQVVTATYNGIVTGTLRVVALSPDVPPPQAMHSMTNFLGDGNARQATVLPDGPDLLGAGTHTQTVTVRACIDGDSVCSTNQVPGSPQTFTVNYVIGPPPVPADLVMPRVATMGIAERVVIRGSALGGTTSVHFGSTAATSVVVVSNTEVHATYPASLGAGVHAVTLNSGAIAFTGSIVAVPPTNYSSATLDLPADPETLRFLSYDAERRALFAGAIGGEAIWRFTYDGTSWSAPQVFPIAGLAHAVLSPDGSRIFATTRSDGMLELDADDLSVLRSTPAPLQEDGTGPVWLQTLTIANNGMAYVAGNSTTSPSYYFSIVDRTFNTTRTSGGTGVNRASLDGSRLMGSGSSVWPPATLGFYDSSTMMRSQKSPSSSHVTVMAARHGDKYVTLPQEGASLQHYVYATADDALLGRLPGSTSVSESNASNRPLLAEVNPQGTRAYLLMEDEVLHTYALDQPTVDGLFPEIGTPLTIDTRDTFNARLIATMTHDGRALFIGGNRAVLVIPTLD